MKIINNKNPNFLSDLQFYLESRSQENNEEIEIKRVAETVINITKSNSGIEFHDLPTNDPLKRMPDISKIHEKFDWQPTIPLEKGIKKSLDYGMIYLTHDNETSPLNYYDQKSFESFLKSYRLSDRRVRSNRYTLEKNLPFTKNIKFKFWK